MSSPEGCLGDPKGSKRAAKGSRQTSWVIIGSRVTCNLQGNVGDLDGPRGSMEMFRGPRGLGGGTQGVPERDV